MISILELVASSRGGGAVHVRDLTRVVDSSRFTPAVAMAEDGGNVTAADFTDYGVPFHQLDIASGPSLTALLKLRKLVRRESFDILHCHGARAAFYGRAVAGLLGGGRPRVVYTIHGFAAPHYGLARRTVLMGMEHILSLVTDAVICVSEAERNSFVAAGFGPPERLRLVRHGIEIAQFASVEVDGARQRAALGIPSDAPLVTTISRLYRPRDFDTLLRAFAVVRAQSSDAHLLIVGDGPYRARIETLISELGLGRSVALAGFRRDIPEILAVSDVFVLSTALWEALGLTILEAMASQLPVVASDVEGVKEAVIHQETGVLVPPKNPGALSQALLDLLANDQEAKAMGKRGRERVYELFTLERMGRETTQLYEDLLGQT